MSNLPARITRWCCEGKSCGNTELKLIKLDEMPAGYPMLYDYVRVSNDESYTGAWHTELGIRGWLTATERNLNP